MSLNPPECILNKFVEIFSTRVHKLTCGKRHSLERELATLDEKSTSSGINPFYDIVPPKPAIFFNERFMAARHKEEYYRLLLKNKESIHFLVCKEMSNDRMTSGCRRTPFFGRYDRELVLKAAISLT